MITAIRMSHFCHVFYHRLPRDLPLVANGITPRKFGFTTLRILKEKKPNPSVTFNEELGF